MRRLVALTLAAVLTVVALTGCVQNLPTSARDWLSGQDGVASADLLADNTGAWSSSGLVRGELDPDITDARLSALIGKIQGYSTNQGGVAFWLGIDEQDFGVAAGDNKNSIALWRQVRKTDGVLSGIVYDGDVRARTLRDDAGEVLDALVKLDSGVRLEAFTDQAAADADRDADIQSDQPNRAAIEYRRTADCEPDARVLDFGLSLLDRTDITGATADLCAGFTLDLPADVSLADTAVAMRADIDARGLSEFSVQLDGSPREGLTHFAAISPGRASVLPVLRVFEGAGVPELSYSLGPDSNIAVTAYDVPTKDLVALIQSSPQAAELAGIGLEGDPVAIAGILSQLPRLLDQATTLAQSSDAYGSVTLGQGFGTVTLQADGTNTPDIDEAVADLRATHLTDRRFFSVYYAAFQADIVNNVAQLTDPNYVGADVMVAFVDTWNSATG